MDQQLMPDLEHDIIRLLQQRGKDYLTVRQLIVPVYRRACASNSASTRRQTTAELLKKLTPWPR